MNNITKFLRIYFPLLALLATSSYFFFVRLGRDLLYDWDECIYATYTHAMKSGSTLLANTFNGGFIFDKPPMYGWILSMATVMGESEFAMRAPSVVAALVLITSVYVFAYKTFSRNVAILAALLLLTVESVVSRAMIVNTDIFFTLFIFLAVWSWLAAPKRSWLAYLAGFFLGLGVMIKGFGSLQFLTVMLICAILEQSRESLVRLAKVIAGFVLTIAPWHITAFILYKQEFIQMYFIDNLLKRSLYPIENHHEHWYFYFKLIIIEFFPWIAFAAVIPVYLYRRINHVRSLRELKRAWELNRTMFTLILMVGLPIMSMTRVATKLSWYAMPVVPFICIVLAYYLYSFLTKASINRLHGDLGKTLARVIFGVCVLLIAIDAFTVLNQQSQPAKRKRDISPRNAAIFAARELPGTEIEHLVPYGERRGREVLPVDQTLKQTWLYGGNACAVYYSKKKVNFFYDAKDFVVKMNRDAGLYMVENGDLHFVKDIPGKKKVFENIEFTIFTK